MAITTAFPNPSKLEALQALCPSSATFKMALYTSAATLDKTATVYSTTNEVSGAGYTAGGKTLTGYNAAMSGDVAVLDFADPTWDNSTISAAGAVIYDATNGNKVRAVLSFSSTITSTNGAFTVQLPDPTATDAIIRVA